MTELRVAVDRIARAEGLDPALVRAVIAQESGWNPYAWNPEPRWRYFWNVETGSPFRPVRTVEIANAFPPKDFPCLKGDRDQEWWAQQASWGLMQIMGAVAREQGFRGPYLPELCAPAINLEYGCRKLKAELVWADNETRAALAAYNGGRRANEPGTPLRNAKYADSVLTRMDSLSA